MSATLGVAESEGVRTSYGVAGVYGVRGTYGVGVDVGVSALFSTLTSSAGSFAAGGAGVTITFTAKNASNVAVQGYTPVPEAGVV